MDYIDALSMFSPSAIAYNIYRRSDLLKSMTGQKQMENMQASSQAQQDYEAYIARGNERALADLAKNEPWTTIRYPELSYPGQIYRANTAYARAGFDYANAGANFYGNFPYRAMGLYGIASRFSRYM